jgi:hypothetical protein
MIDPSTRIFVQHESGLFDPAELWRVREDMSRARAERIAQAALSERERAAVRRGESADAVRKRERWYDVWRHPVSMDRLLSTVRPFTYVTFPVQVRHVTEDLHYVPWHQDRGYIELLGDRGPRQIITCFIPLEEKPAERTTIEFAFDNLGERPERVIQHQPMVGFGAGIEGDRFTHRKHFDMELGDALVFGDLTLHRTYTPPGAIADRRSLEFRLIQPKDALPNRDYFDLERQVFIQTGDTVAAAV